MPITETPLRSKAYQTVLSFLKEVHHTGKVKSKTWNKFSAAINKLPIKQDQISAINFWTLENVEKHFPDLVRLRVLHDVEAVFITPQAHILFLDALHYGMVSRTQGEQIIEELVEMEHFNVYPETMMDSLSRTWQKNTQNYSKIRAN